MSKVISRLIAIVAVLVVALAGINAHANEDYSVGRTAAQWAPVPKLEVRDPGPTPGTQCTQRGEVREFVTMTGSHFDVEGTVSTANDLVDGTVPLQQSLKETKKRRWEWSTNVTVKLTEEVTRKYGWEYNREMFWSMGQNIGPYPLYPGEQGTLAWGFIIDDFTSQRVRCGASMTWEPIGRLQFGSVPRERHVEVQIERKR